MGVLFSLIQGHKETISLLKEHLSHQPVGRTYLFAGPEGVGKRKIAWALSQMLLCLESPKVCGHCVHCRRIEKMEHESVLEVLPKNQQIRIEESHRVLEFLRLQSLTRFRVVIIDEIQWMNSASANALLKILEEPPQDTFFFLLSSSPQRVLSTVRSRALKVFFKPLTTEELSQGIFAPTWALESSRGRFDLLLKKINSESTTAHEEWARELVLFCENPDCLTEASWRESLKDRSQFSDRLRLWLEILRDARTPGEFSIRPELSPITAPLQNLAPEKIHRAFQKLLEFSSDLQFHRDPVLMMEEFIVMQKGAL